MPPHGGPDRRSLLTTSWVFSACAWASSVLRKVPAVRAGQPRNPRGLTTTRAIPPAQREPPRHLRVGNGQSLSQAAGCVSERPRPQALGLWKLGRLSIHPHQLPHEVPRVGVPSGAISQKHPDKGSSGQGFQPPHALPVGFLQRHLAAAPLYFLKF